MLSEEEVAKNLFFAMKNDTENVKKLNSNALYSNQIEEGNVLLTNKSFGDLGLKNELVIMLNKNGFDKPTKIQELSIPIICSGQDGAFHSKSGTGKTIGFACGIINGIEQGKGPQALIVTPTRELNMQIFEVVRKLAFEMNISTCVALKEFMSDNIAEEIVIGCPAKLIGLISRGALKTENLKMIVLDEADEMITKRTFALQTMNLLKLCGSIQKVFFSATYSEQSQKAVEMVSPNCQKFFKENVKADNIKLFYLEVEKNKKIDTLKKILELLTVAQTIVFVNSRKMVDLVAKILCEDGFPVSKLHGELSSEQRDSVLADFASAKTKVLISTDVFSRGMDIPQVNLIVNFDLPIVKFGNNVETYIHRVGRSGRFNRQGFVIDFIACAEDYEVLQTIQTTIKEAPMKFTINALMNIFTQEN
ncbi:FAL1 [Ecytonucleospora hepatopenaei]|uniref:RNA helicase n=1 Tax=Ecytonucleospora hepatopenaei TaxID=646526 RepID=A0A1W0E6Z4_9MICR|nr:FAL1 [Ecytonucleospora hepatopenaei]